MPLAQVPDLIPVLPELFLALVIMALLMFGVFQKGGRQETDVNAFRVISWMAIVALVLTPLLVLARRLAALWMHPTSSSRCSLRAT